VRYWEKARKAGLLGASSASGWGADFGDFYRSVEWMGLQRHLKVAGIFARLTLRDGKPQYLADAPRFIGYIRATASRYRELAPLLRLVNEVEQIQETTGFAYGRV
jgi:aminoglycoside/choline kinase family phosphotransferase